MHEPIEVPADALVLLVGAAGSGKSTLAARLFPADTILSSDAIRGQVSGDETNQAVNAEVFRRLHAVVEQRLADGRLTVVDATNLGAAARRPLRRRAAAHGRPILVLVLDLPAAVCLERNAARSNRVVPEAAVRRQLAALRRVVDRAELEAETPAGLVVLDSVQAVAGVTMHLTGPVGRTTLSGSGQWGRAPNCTANQTRRPPP